MDKDSDQRPDFKSFYFTSLIQLLSDERTKSAVNSVTNKRTEIPHSKRPSSKKYELKLQSEECSGRPLLVDPHVLIRKKEWGRKSLVKNTAEQMSYEKNVSAYEREFTKALHHLKNSKAYHTKSLKKLQDRQMEIMKKKDDAQMLVQAQCLYSKSPVLERSRICVACTKRPKSSMPPVPLFTASSMRVRQKPRLIHSAGVQRPKTPRFHLNSAASCRSIDSGVPKIICYESVTPISPCTTSRSSTPASVHLFDSGLIPDTERL